jgi:hypothetical protein
MHIYWEIRFNEHMAAVTACYVLRAIIAKKNGYNREPVASYHASV